MIVARKGAKRKLYTWRNVNNIIQAAECGSREWI